VRIEARDESDTPEQKQRQKQRQKQKLPMKEKQKQKQLDTTSRLIEAPEGMMAHARELNQSFPRAEPR
jgi:hypothetical protein